MLPRICLKLSNAVTNVIALAFLLNSIDLVLIESIQQTFQMYQESVVESQQSLH